MSDEFPRVAALETRVGEVEKGQAVMMQRLITLDETVKGGTSEIKASIVALAAEQKADVAALLAQQREDAKAGREESRWWWGKVFALGGTIATLATGGAGVAYWQQAPRILDAPAVEAPAPEAPAEALRGPSVGP